MPESTVPSKGRAAWHLSTSTSVAILATQASLVTVLLHKNSLLVDDSRLFPFSPAEAVFLVEVLKAAGLLFTISYLLATCHSSTWSQTEVSSKTNGVFVVLRRIFNPQLLTLTPIAALYLVESLLQFEAARHLDVPTLQLGYSLKIVCATCFSNAALGRRLTPKKWIALALLISGVGMVHSEHKVNEPAELVRERSKGLGFIAVGCLLSGVANAFTESLPLSATMDEADYLIRAAQMSLVSIPSATMAVFLSPAARPDDATLPSLFSGFTNFTWSLTLIQAFGGIYAARLATKIDGANRAFAHSVAFVACVVAGVACFQFAVTPQFLCGATLALVSVFLYSTDRRATFSFISPSDIEAASFITVSPPSRMPLTPPHSPKRSQFSQSDDREVRFSTLPSPPMTPTEPRPPPSRRNSALAALRAESFLPSKEYEESEGSYFLLSEGQVTPPRGARRLGLGEPVTPDIKIREQLLDTPPTTPIGGWVGFGQSPLPVKEGEVAAMV